MDRDYAQSLISDPTYHQEKQYITFLEAFAELKKYVEAYTLAYEIRNTDLSKNLFAVLSAFGELKKVAKAREKSYGRDPLYKKVFRPQYQSILRQAELYLEKDRNLKNSATLADNLIRLRELGDQRLDYHFREDYLAGYYAVDLPPAEFMNTTPIGQELLQQLSLIEDMHYQQTFRQDCEALYQAKPDPIGIERRNKLLERINRSHCRLCKDKVMEAIRHFDQSRSQAEATALLLEKEKLVEQTENKVFTFLKHKDCLNSRFSSFGDEKPSHIRHLENRHALTLHKLGQLEEALRNARKIRRDAGLMRQYMEEMQFLSQAVEADYGDYCKKAPELCDCGE